MPDFIDRHAAMNVVGLTTDAIKIDSIETKYIDAQGNELVTVGRCKDCRKWCICHRGDDFYGADGERREDETN